MGLIDKMFRKAFAGGLASAYKDFMSDDGEFDNQPFKYFDAEYALPTLYEFFDKHAEVYDKDENDIYYTYQFYFNEQNFIARVYHKYPSTIMILVIKELQVTKTKQDLNLFCNKVNLIDPIHQIGHLVNKAGKLSIWALRQIIITPSIGGMGTIELCLNQLNEYADRLSKGQLPKADDWKQYAIRPKVGIKGADRLLFPAEKENTLFHFSNRSKLILDDQQKTVHEMIRIDKNKSHVINAFGDIINLDTELIDDYHITTYKDFPYLAVFSATIYPANYTSPLLIRKERMQDVSNQWNKTCHFSVAKVIAKYPSHWEGDDWSAYKYKIMMTGLFAESINTFTYYNMIGTMEKAIGYLIRSHGLF